MMTVGREPVADLIAAVHEAKTAENIAYDAARPLSRAYGQARADLAAELMQGLLYGEPFEAWAPALQALAYSLPATRDGMAWSTLAEAIGRDIAAWIRFNVPIPDLPEVPS